jgi:hypothetical protein
LIMSSNLVEISFSLVPKEEELTAAHLREQTPLLEPLVFVTGYCDEDGDLDTSVIPKKTWQSGVQLTANKAGEVSNSQVAIDANGHALAVWELYDGMHSYIWSSRYTASFGWGALQCIEVTRTGNAVEPQIAMNANGEAIAVWRTLGEGEGVNASYNLWANLYTFDKGWGVARLIELNSISSVWGACSPKVAMDAGGNALVVWQQFDSKRNTMLAKRYVVGQGWATAEVIDSNTAGHADLLQIATDAKGNAMVVWQRFDDMRSNIWVNRYVLGAGWGQSNLVETENNGGSFNPQIAMDVHGKALVVWEQYKGSRWGVWANRYVPDIGWGTARPIEVDRIGQAGSPQVAMDSNGDAIAVWVQRDGVHYSIWTNRCVVGTGWGAAKLLEMQYAGSVSEPQVTIDADGNAMVTWWQSGVQGYKNILAARYESSIGWSCATVVNKYLARDALQPLIITDTNSAVIAAWKQFNSSRNSIWNSGNR